MEANGQPPASAITYDLIQPLKINNQMLAAGTITLLVVVFLVLCAHVYAKVFWRRPLLPALASAQPPLARCPDGLAKATIASLPTFSYTSPPCHEQALLECAVCLHEFSENEEGRLLPSCGHSFHTHCIDMWFHSHTTCPLCRTAVTISAEEIPPNSVKAGNLMSNSPLPAQLLRCCSAPQTCSVMNSMLLPLNLGSPNDLLVLGDHSHACCQSGYEKSKTEASPLTICSSPKVPAEAVRCATTRSFSRCPPEDAHEALLLTIVEQSYTNNPEVLEKKRESMEESNVVKEYSEHDEEAAVA